MQNANLLFALGSLVFSLLLLFSNVLLIVFNEGEGSHQSGQVIVFVELLMMGRTKTQVREDVGGCSRLRDMSANLDQVVPQFSSLRLHVVAHLSLPWSIG